jgi:oxaloacetate decarboxylase alpha subunit
VVPDEVKKYVLGYFGRLPFPVDPDVKDRIVENGSRKIARKPPPLEPVVPKLRARYPNLSDDERVLRFLFPGEQVDAMQAEQPKAHDFSVEHPLVELLRGVARRRGGRVHVRRGASSLSLKSGG